MCDDFFEDHFENDTFDSGNDYDEDFADEYGEELIDVFDEPGRLPEKEEQRLFDLGDAIIFGSMIYGNAYEEGLDDKKRKQLLKSREKKED